MNTNHIVSHHELQQKVNSPNRFQFQRLDFPLLNKEGREGEAEREGKRKKAYFTNKAEKKIPPFIKFLNLLTGPGSRYTYLVLMSMECKFFSGPIKDTCYPWIRKDLLVEFNHL